MKDKKHRASWTSEDWITFWNGAGLVTLGSSVLACLVWGLIEEPLTVGIIFAVVVWIVVGGLLFKVLADKFDW